MDRGLLIICSGDLHVGRRPSRVGGCIDPTRCSCAAMFSEIVELAIRQRVDAVAITGDLIDRENKYHEAYGPVERGLRRLAQAEIDVIAVSGNHDWDVLPRLAADLGSERFHLLGPAGTWERKLIRPVNAAPFIAIGWSFPAEQVMVSPLASLAPQLGVADGATVIGLLHADLDQLDSPYAPVALSELRQAPVSAWLLGHVHKPRWIPPGGSGAGVLYPGSPQAMDPGETGAHGPWMVKVDASGRTTAWQAPMSLVRYESLDIDLTQIESKAALDSFIPKEIRRQLTDLCRSSGPLELCSLRLRLVGTTALHRQLRGFVPEIQQLDLTIEGFATRIDKITIDTRPPIDLDRLSRGSGVVADLATLLRRLSSDDGGSDLSALLTNAAELSESVSFSRAYQDLVSCGFPAPGPEATRSALLRNGMLLLDTLLAQQQTPEAL